MVSVIQTTAWLMSNLVRGTPFPEYEQVKKLQPLMLAFLEIEDDHVLADTLWALSNIASGPDNQIEDLCDHENFAEKVTALMNHEDPVVKLAALRTVAGCLTTNDESIVDVRKT